MLGENSPESGTVLVRYDAACRALAEAKAVDEVKDLLDKSEAMRIYGRQAQNKSLEIDAAEIRLRAERRLGELIAAQKETVGLNSGRAGRAPIAVVDDDRDTRPRLSDVGISKDLSSRAQKIAAVPEPEFERQVGEWRDRVSSENARVTVNLEATGAAALRGKGKKQEEPPPEPDSELVEELRQTIAELSANLEETLAENESMGRAFDADDRAKGALAEAKRYREENRILKERINGLQGERDQAIRLAKAAQAKLAKLEKGAKRG